MTITNCIVAGNFATVPGTENLSGTIIHAEVVPSGTFGYSDWPNWVPRDGNVGRAGTDFSQFQAFQRAVIIIEVRYKGAADGQELVGYVASIPVGLDTIGSVVLDDDIVPGKIVRRGDTRLGNFFLRGFPQPHPVL